MALRQGSWQNLDDGGRVVVTGKLEIDYSMPRDGWECDGCGQRRNLFANTINPDSRMAEKTCLECLVEDSYVGAIWIGKLAKKEVVAAGK
jgi:tRNA G26 N,N-dimethylase Trm1